MFLRYLHFCRDILGYVAKQLEKELTLFSKFMTSQTGTQRINAVLPNISNSKRQRDNEIWSVIRIQRENYFSLKVMR